MTKPSRGVIVTEAVKKAAYCVSDSCLKLEQLGAAKCSVEPRAPPEA